MSEILFNPQESRMKFDPFASMIAGGLLLLYLALCLFSWKSRRQTASLQFSMVSHLQAAGRPWKVRLTGILPVLRFTAILFLLIAFARPQKGLEVIKTAREGIAIQMVIDRSSSMKEPLTFHGQEADRLDVVKLVLKDFIKGDGKTLKGRANDMIGLNSFAGFVEENSPLTLDHNTLVSFAKTITPANRIEDGTMIGDALYYSTLRLISVDELLRKAAEQENDYEIKSKIIILLTDGQQTRGGMNPVKAAEFARDNGIKVYTIAITSDERYQRQNGLFGQFFSLMNTQLDTSMLEEVAAITGGMFAKASSGEALVEIYRQIDQMEKSQFEEAFTTYKELFPLFVTIGLSLLLLEWTLSQTLLRKIP